MIPGPDDMPKDLINLILGLVHVYGGGDKSPKSVATHFLKALDGEYGDDLKKRAEAGCLQGTRATLTAWRDGKVTIESAAAKREVH